MSFYLMYIDKSRQRVARKFCKRVFCKEGGVLQKCFFRSRVETDWRAAGADRRSQDATGVHGSAAPKEDKMWRMNPSDDDDDGNDWEEGEVDPEKDWEPPDWLR